MIEPEEHFVRVQGVRLRYVDWGDNGPPILLLHGDMRTSRSWDAVARDLCPRFHVISLDFRGHGDSDWTPTGYRFDEKVADLAGFCQSIRLRKAIGVGHSSGGVALVLFAQRYPGTFSRLVLLEPMMIVDREFQSRVSSRSERPRRTWASREELHEYLKQHPMAGRWREDVILDVVNHEAMELPDGTIDMKWAAAIMNWSERHADYFDLQPTFYSLGLPILFIVSDQREHQQGYSNLRPMAAELHDFHVLTVNRSAHNIYMDRPDAVSWAIETFVGGRELPGAI